MVPAVTSETTAAITSDGHAEAAVPLVSKVSFNPFYSNIPTQEDNENYQFAHYKVSLLLNNSSPFVYSISIVLEPTWPKVDWEPLTEFPHTDVGHRADPEKKALLSSATKVDHISPAIGTRLEGIDLRTLTNTQKDELYASPAISQSNRHISHSHISTELSWLRSVPLLASTQPISHAATTNQHLIPVFENQDITIEEQLALARHFGPLHKHATTGVPAEGNLDEVHGKLSQRSTIC
jgi:sulfonate dioxygenase